LLRCADAASSWKRMPSRIPLEPSLEARRRQRAYYLANVTMIDKKVGDILQALEAKNLLEHSIVIFTSDHGDTLGDHGLSQKWTMYEQVVRVPLVVWAPGLVPQGRRAQQLVQLMDLAPTILEWAGVDVPEFMQAESLSKIIGQDSAPGREFVFAELGPDNVIEQIKFMTMVRSKDWKLVHFLGSSDGQLFDLTQDPHEEHNLWRDPAFAAEKSRLIDALLNWRIETQIKSRGWTADYR
jgi:arylsulfatase